MKKVLLMLGGGYHPFPAAGEIMTEFLTKQGFEVESTEDRGRFKKLKDFDAVVIYTQGGKLTPAQEKGLLGYVNDGGGVVGIHSASDSFKDNEGYMEMIGSEFIGHGPMADISVEMTPGYEKILPRTAGSWKQFDEFYLLKSRTKKKVNPLQFGWWQFDRKLLTYTRSYGKGRVFYTGLGHDERAFRHPEFQDMLVKALRWVGKVKEKAYRWGIVGYGPLYGMGEHHAELMAQTSGIEVTAICDKDPARVKAAKERHGKGLQYFTDYRDLIKAGCCDGVTTILPHNIHAEVTTPLLEAGLRGPVRLVPVE